MFDVLVESGVRRSVGLGPRVASLWVHGMVLVVAGLGWRWSVVEAPPKPASLPIEIFEEPTPTPSRLVVRAGGIPTIGDAPVTPDVPVDVPTTIPPIMANQSAADSAPTAQALVRRELWGKGSHGQDSAEGLIRLVGEVDEPVTVLRALKPVYPTTLAAAGISGEVRLEFVVDTAGRGEPTSVRVVSSTALAFERPAIAAVLGATYRAARVRGQPVRQLVHQRVAFRMN